MTEQKNHESLEALISKISFNIVKEEILSENEINKLLGVLSNDGVYAMWVYALKELELKFSQDEEELRNCQLFKFLNKISELDKFITNSLNFGDLIKEVGVNRVSLLSSIFERNFSVSNIQPSPVPTMMASGFSTDASCIAILAVVTPILIIFDIRRNTFGAINFL